MKTLSVKVKSKSVTVGVAEYPEYDAVAEAIEHQSEESILKLVNAQARTNAMNVVRNAVVARPSKKKLMRKARASITADEFVAVAGDPDAIDALIDKKAKELLEAGETEE